MLSFVLEVDASGVKIVTDRIGSAFGAGFEPELKVIQKKMADSVKQNFLSHGRPAWQPNSPVTTKRRRDKARRTGQQPVAGDEAQLIETGELMKSMTDTTGAVPDSVAYVNGKEAVIGTRKPQAAIQNYGGTVTSASGRSTTIPAREYAVNQDEDIREYQEILTVGISRRIDGVMMG